MREVKDHRSVSGSEGGEMGGWVWQRRDRQVGLIVARSAGGSDSGEIRGRKIDRLREREIDRERERLEWLEDGGG